VGRISAAKATQKPTKDAGAGKTSKAFTTDEQAAMREHVREAKDQTDGESAVLAKIAEMEGSDRAMAQTTHAIIEEKAPTLSPRTWYGMPGYAKDGKVVCHFQPAQKFKTRYATFGFSDAANLDAGAMWPKAVG
jgi:hypothetical protein